LRHYLLVDDNRAFGENLAEILRDEGAEVTLSTSGPEALELAGKTRFDALVTDMRMPLMSGAALIHEVRAVDPDLPAVVVTAYTQESDLADARREGVLGVLPKPVPIPALTALLSAARRGGVVALIEDDASMADNLSEALRARGFTALTAASAMEAERLGGVKPFAAITDLKLPGSPRGEIVARLKERFGELPLFIITGFPDVMPKVRHEALLEKPFDTARLLDQLERLYLERAGS
jgi:two-component system, response regulator PdtaR